jgi:hypothetical protein
LAGFANSAVEIAERILGGYPDINEQWKLNTKLSDGRPFKKAVNDYQLPDEEGFNKLNSVRVNAFYEALRALQGVGDPKDQQLAPLLKAISTLREDDARYLANDKEAVAIAKLMKRKLCGDALDDVKRRIRERITGASAARTTSGSTS